MGLFSGSTPEIKYNLRNENRKKSRCVRTNGSIEYSDIKDFRYIVAKFEGYYPSNRSIAPPRVVIIGDDFEVEIYAYKSLIKRIKEVNLNQRFDSVG